jgi:hypothetical protein
MTASLHRSFVLALALLSPLGAYAQEPTGDGEPTEPAPPVEAQAGLDVFPLDQGYRWNFQVKWSIEPKSTGEQALPPEESVQSLEVYVAPPQTVGGTPASVVEWKLDGDLSQRCYFVVRGRSVLCVKRIQGFGEHMKEFNLDPGQPDPRRHLPHHRDPGGIHRRGRQPRLDPPLAVARDRHREGRERGRDA